MSSTWSVKLRWRELVSRPRFFALVSLLLCVSCSAAKPVGEDAAVAADAAPADAAAEDAGPIAGSDAAADSAKPDTAVADTGPPDLDVAIGDAGLVTAPDGCTPNCKGKICGPNGCGAVCGFCKSGEFCAADGSKCSGFCDKDCTNKACGPDGCNGVCGTCASGLHCGDDFKCYTDSCVGSCAGKVCGDDGCGKTCGLCAGNDFCDAGQCKANACKGIDAQKGNCEGDFLIACTGSGAAAKKLTKDCAAPPNLQNLTCGWDPAVNKNACIAKACDPSCTTDAGDKIVCGNNACGKPCGACADGWKCNVTACAPADGATCTLSNFAQEGQCQGSVWVYCNTGKIKMVDCLKMGFDSCGWNGAAAKFECK